MSSTSRNTHITTSSSNTTKNKLLNSSIELGANKAYLCYNGTISGDVKGFIIGFSGEDGIETIDNGQLTIDNGKESIYNLAGQRLSKPQHGVNIINGKKVFIK